MRIRAVIPIFVLIALTIIGCQRRTPLPSETLWQPVDRSEREIAMLDDGSIDSLQTALQSQVEYFVHRMQNGALVEIEVANRKVSVSDLRTSYEKLLAYLHTKPTAYDLRSYLGTHFDTYRYRGQSHDRKILVTAYFVPEYNASPIRTDRFRYPIYPVPSDLGRGSRPYTRFDIDYREAIKGTQPLAWLDNPVDVLFLQIQGSGVLRWPDGSKAKVGYAGDNGYPYVSLGNLMIRDKVRPEDGFSLKGLKKHFVMRPDEFKNYAKKMPRYIFFRFEEQAVGTLGLPVIPKRTIAVDPNRIPLGILAFLMTRRPVVTENDEIVDWQKLSLLVMSQDTGGGIRGDHVDLYWGEGDEAGRHAQYLKERGSLYVLLPRDMAEKANSFPENVINRKFVD